MGATSFFNHYPCNQAEVSADRAFADLTQRARYDHGHNGQTGTIGDKHEFVEIAGHSRMSAEEYAWELLDDRDARVDDKYGPAGCIRTPTGYLFFGMAPE